MEKSCRSQNSPPLEGCPKGGVVQFFPLELVIERRYDEVRNRVFLCRRQNHQ
jgi:hypothetical protein